MNQKINKILSILILLGLLSLIFQFHNFNQNNNSSYNDNLEKEIHLSAGGEWLSNNDFTTQEFWFYTEGIKGDNSAINTSISGGTANFEVLGEKQTQLLISGTPNKSGSPGWKILENQNFLLPKTRAINDSGCYVHHFLDENIGGEQINNYPSVHFKKNISITDDMSKYIITSVSLDVMANASVDPNVDTLHDDYFGPSPDQQAVLGDSVTFYVEISDLVNSYIFRLAENKTTSLGQDNPPTYPNILNITDSLLSIKNQQYLLSALTSVLETDNHNFTITLGMDIYCEDNDNSGGDRDTWNYLIIKSCNLSITYERKIERFTSVSLNQVGDIISGDNIQIKDASLNYKYRIDQSWPGDLSPFTEIRTLLNNNPYFESIKLTSANSSFQEVKVGGYDVTSLILKDVNITLSIEFYIANTFALNRTIIISIDDVSLIISYVSIKPGIDTTPYIIGLTAGIIGLVTAFSLYQFHFKYPPLVRKIRKLRKKVRKAKKIKPILVNKRDEIVRSNFQSQIKFLNIELPQLIK